ncbi:hypothetical protein [Fusobacterium varium]|uniref:hypothetical protein n=1 Tax=Fusobacterium varium TaxID=856 RepID=UPI0001AFF450|nr:hypothetical protein [Fusobacterium varium]EES62848.1 hypothetical protein FVAG_00537 [Fusobacterium varium ATCC 27725]
MKKIDSLFINLIIFSVLFFDIRTRIQIISAFLFLVYLVLKNEFKINKKVCLLLIYIFISSIVAIVMYEYKFNKMIQQMIVITIITVSYWMFFSKYGVIKIWNKYLKMCKLFCLIGIVQWVVYYLFNINIFQRKYFFWGIENNYGLLKGILQFSSMSGEPGNYAQVIMPAVFYLIEESLKVKKIKIQDLIFIISYICTFTAIAFMGFILYVFFKVIVLIKNKEIKKIFYGIGASMIMLPIFIKIFNIGMIKIKIFETSNYILNLMNINLNKVNLSTFALFSNLKAAILSRHFIFGNGLGTIQQVYYKYLVNENYFFYGINSEDGYSMAVRIFTEFGLIGLLIIGYILIKNLFYDRKNFLLSTINFSATIGIISYLIRWGSYYTFGAILFYIFLIFSKKEYKKTMKEKINERNNISRRKWNKTLSNNQINIKTDNTNI